MGCHFSHQAQRALLPSLRRELDKCGLTEMPIAASDENQYDGAVATWESFDAGTRRLINQVNVHGYEGERGNRTGLYDMVHAEGKRLWNSEYGEGDATGLTLARNLSLDLTYLHPTAWCYWQPCDLDGWGWIRSDLASGKMLGLNPKYFVVAQYTRHIRPGMTLLKTGDASTVAAYDPAAHKLVLVVYTTEGSTRTIDLSAFASATGPVVRWITEPNGLSRYEMQRDIEIVNRTIVAKSPANSVQTFEVDGVTLR